MIIQFFPSTYIEKRNTKTKIKEGFGLFFYSIAQQLQLGQHNSNIN